MFLDFTAMEPRHAYQWMVAAIVPRPIAWVSTVSPDGRTNLAPFSFFQGVTCNPPTLLFVPGNTREGRKKDTLLNIEANRDFVVSLPSFAQAEQMNATAALLPYGDSEFEAFGIASAPSERVRPPRVAGAGVAFECTLLQIVPVGEGPLAANVVFGRILCAHVREEILGADGLIDPARQDAIGRMGGEGYTRSRERFDLARPDRAPLAAPAPSSSRAPAPHPAPGSRPAGAA
jgi:flavin reductase (DIM6/NTAB) family NADH-FMN oxidoreductase RutF